MLVETTLQHSKTTSNKMNAANTESSSGLSSEVLAECLVAVAERRCRTSFSKLFSHFAPRLRSYALKQIGNEAIAMELVQDTLTNVWQKAHLFNGEKGMPSTWVFTIARNLRFDFLRKMQSRKEDICADDLWPVLVEQTASLDEELVDDTVTLEQILEKVGLLPEKQKQVILAVYVHGKSQQEVADETDTPLGTIKSRTRLALQKLKELLDEND
ncbi:sigma-70 family RNA polymerase sigma factor [Alteromonas sp. a30]|uniref:sigma-70 family RNA polymerase sigma factor n=1 Tax=Alteromonas sp. a30 TaxID=2730917 RepID=UPI00227E4C09|nr:sigma-70 family RNA polymerase sigma factor [Alteromonas sp. a30]MCY7297110.1 sigma-70 family RNA polymerase sigma factor [Alteromonas sp. a30]